ncbi:MAG: hypothetical protein U0223_12060 [Nitrospira sp.]|nr:hypothetical protein [Nitrospira sp.]
MTREVVNVCNNGDIELLYASLGTRVQLLAIHASIEGLYTIPPGACRDVMPLGMKNVTVAFFHVDKAGQLGNVVYSLEGEGSSLKEMKSDRMCVKVGKFADDTFKRRQTYSQFVQSWSPPCPPGLVSVKNTFMAWGGTNFVYTIDLTPSLDDPVIPLMDQASQSHDKRFDDGADYVGQLKDGVPHGHGVMRWPDGRVYEGEWQSGNREGQGRARWPDGRHFSGSWEKNEPQQGTWTLPNHRTFTGRLVNDLPDGPGTMTLPDGRQLEGRWKNGKFVGTERWEWPRGRSKDATPSHDDLVKPRIEEKSPSHHQGGNPPTENNHASTQDGASRSQIKTFGDGAQYEGQMQDGAPHGKGVMRWPDGRRYDGEWRSGKRDGVGIMSLPDGGKFEGHWKNGKPEGTERWEWPDGRKFRGSSDDPGKGQWGLLTWPDRQSFYGPLRDFKPHGEGKTTLPDGSRFNSVWENGVLKKKLD